MPDAAQSVVPPEILYHIFENLPRSTLASTARANSSFQNVSEKYIYKRLQLNSIPQAIQCCQTLLSKPSAAQAVREFIVLLDHASARSLPLTFPPLLTSALQALSKLESLHLALQGPYLTILQSCTFPHLVAFSSILDLQPSFIPMANFLSRHPTITHLCLGGDSPADPRAIFSPLPPNILPRLNTYIGSRRLVPVVVPQRPVSALSLAWNGPDIAKEIDCILPFVAKSAVPVTTFSVSTHGWSVHLLRAIAVYVPSLQTLRLHNVSPDYHNEGELLKELTNVLPIFTDIHTLEIPCRGRPGTQPNANSVLIKETEAALLVRWTSHSSSSSSSSNRRVPPNSKLACVKFVSGRTWQRRRMGANGAWSGWSLLSS